MPTKCQIHNCAKPSVSRGLCDTHRKRVARHGSVAQTRPADWGSKEKHPAYKAWCNLRRYHKTDTPSVWLQDFWAFAREVPVKPDGVCRMARPDPDKPWGPENFYWKETPVSVEHRAGRAAYMREYSRKMRQANPEYHKSLFLRRHYGIDVRTYNEMLVAQGDCCDICGKAESNEIKGKVVSLAVDHDHVTGKVRALLCSACNTALGLLNDDTDLLAKAIEYLTRHRA